MPRISQEDIAKRESFLYNLFKEFPELTAAKANDKVQEKFGNKMRPPRVYEIRNMVSKGQELSSAAPASAAPAVARTSAPRGRPPKKAIQAVPTPHMNGKHVPVADKASAAFSDEEQAAIERLKQIAASVGWINFHCRFDRVKHQELSLNDEPEGESGYLRLDQAG